MAMAVPSHDGAMGMTTTAALDADVRVFIQAPPSIQPNEPARLVYRLTDTR